jgi:hypothetical protein
MKEKGKAILNSFNASAVARSIKHAVVAADCTCVLDAPASQCSTPPKLILRD